MTKKDYVAIARQVQRCAFPMNETEYARGHADARRTIAEDLCEIFAADNPRFDRVRFLAACGVQS